MFMMPNPPHTKPTPPQILLDDTCNVCEYKAININALNEHTKSVHDINSSPLPKPNGVEAGTPDNPISTDNATEVSMYTQEPNNLNNHL